MPCRWHGTGAPPVSREICDCNIRDVRWWGGLKTTSHYGREAKKTCNYFRFRYNRSSMADSIAFSSSFPLKNPFIFEMVGSGSRSISL